MKNKKAVENYRKIFSTEKMKAEAFDKIAEKYYYGNFGSVSKTDFDVLMFSIYIERILETNESDLTAYSDYSLSKVLGVTQSKVSSLKVKKQLQYPYDGFEWKKSLLRIADRAIYEDGKIKLFISDRNLYLEIKNAIEESGGFVEVQLTQNLLQVNLKFFLDLMVAIEEEKDRAEIIKQIKKNVERHAKDTSVLENQPIGRSLADIATETITSIICDSIPALKCSRELANKLISIIKKQF